MVHHVIHRSLATLRGIERIFAFSLLLPAQAGVTGRAALVPTPVDMAATGSSAGDDRAVLQFSRLCLRRWNLRVKLLEFPGCVLGRVVVASTASLLPDTVDGPVQQPVDADGYALVREGDVLVGVNDVAVAFQPLRVTERAILSSVEPPVLTFVRHPFTVTAHDPVLYRRSAGADADAASGSSPFSTTTASTVASVSLSAVVFTSGGVLGGGVNLPVPIAAIRLPPVAHSSHRGAAAATSSSLPASSEALVYSLDRAGGGSASVASPDPLPATVTVEAGVVHRRCMWQYALAVARACYGAKDKYDAGRQRRCCIAHDGVRGLGLRCCSHCDDRRAARVAAKIQHTHTHSHNENATPRKSCAVHHVLLSWCVAAVVCVPAALRNLDKTITMATGRSLRAIATAAPLVSVGGVTKQVPTVPVFFDQARAAAAASATADAPHARPAAAPVSASNAVNTAATVELVSLPAAASALAAGPTLLPNGLIAPPPPETAAEFNATLQSAIKESATNAVVLDSSVVPLMERLTSITAPGVSTSGRRA